jgi:4-hydroxy-tetrahydrodipicolinate synthase
MNTLRQTARARLRGALLGLTTPFTAAGAFDEKAFRGNVEFYVESGFRALVVAGTYGEVTALTQDERRRVIRAATQQARGRAAILADTHHVGSLDEVIALTRRAEEDGADYAYVLTPYYFRPTDEGLVAFYRQVAGATRMPIVLYTNGWRTHVRLKPEVVRALLDCETIVAIKAADPDIADLSDLIALVGDELAISCGWEVHAIHGAALGARSYFGIAGNFNPALEHRYEHALEAMDLGELRQIHALLSPLRRFFSEVDAPVTLKAAQEMAGLAGGPVRLPLSPMTEAQRGRLRAILVDLGTKVVG